MVGEAVTGGVEPSGSGAGGEVGGIGVVVGRPVGRTSVGWLGSGSGSGELIDGAVIGAKSSGAGSAGSSGPSTVSAGSGVRFGDGSPSGDGVA